MTLCILHLGAEKTGTSSIQKYLGVHREALLAQGLWYPESFTNPSGHVHLKLSSAAVDGSLDPANPQGVAFRAELDHALKRGARTVVFSSEFFHSELRDKGAVERLKAFLSSYFDRFKLVYYARRQDQMLASMHSTAIQGGWTTDPQALSVYGSKPSTVTRTSCRPGFTLMACDQSLIGLPSSPIFTRLEAVISSNSMPYGLIRK